MNVKFSLLEISRYGWSGISICTFETTWENKSLLHIEYTENTWKFGFLWFIKFII